MAAGERSGRRGSGTTTRAQSSNGTNGRSPLRASARRIDLRAKQKDRLIQMGGPNEPWQEEAWAFYDTSPEAGNAIQFAGNALAKLRLYPAVVPLDDPDGEPIPADDPESGIDAGLAAAARDQLARLRSPLGGQGEILRTLTMNVETVGEGYLVMIAARTPTEDEVLRARLAGDEPPQPTPERCEVLSISEVEVRGKATSVMLDGQKVALDPDRGDTITRVWQRHPRWSTKADCATRHCLPALRILAALRSQVLATTNSQMHAGILLLSNQMTFSGQPVSTPADNEEHQTPFEDALDDSFAIPVEAPDDLLTIRPMVIFGSKEDIEAAKHLTMSREVDKQLEVRIDQNVRTYARGANLPVEVIEGHMATTFANAEQIDQDTFDDYLEPRTRLIVDSITVGHLQPELLQLPQFPEDQVRRLICWYDASELIGQPDTAGAATEGLKEGAISGEAWRRTKGYSEADAPEMLEFLTRLAFSRGEIGPEVVRALLEAMAKEAGVELPPAPAPLPPPPPGPAPGEEPEEPEDEEPVTAAGQGRPLGTRLSEIDQKLFDRLMVAMSLAMDRALERAGARLRSKARTGPAADLIANASNQDVARLMGPALVADVSGEDDPLDGAWVALEPLFRKQVGQAQRDARGAAARRVPIQTGAVEQTQAEDLDEAWDWTQAELTRRAQRAMYGEVATAELGEDTPELRIPAGLVRQAMARAGGIRGIEARGAEDGYLTLLAGQEAPAGGVATGTTMMEALTAAGAAVEGWTWIWGDAARPFEPHVALDGVQYTSYDDPELANTDVWPPFPHYFPGDHLGCTCRAEPTILGPDDIGL